MVVFVDAATNCAHRQWSFEVFLKILAILYCFFFGLVPCGDSDFFSFSESFIDVTYCEQ